MQNLKIKIQNYRILLLAILLATLVLPALIKAASINEGGDILPGDPRSIYDSDGGLRQQQPTWKQLSPTEQQYRDAANCEALGISPEQCFPGGGSRTILPIKSSTGGGSQSIKIPNPLGNVKTFGELINRLVNWLLIIGAPILTLMIIVGAFQIMTGAGEPEKITKGRHTITYAIIGYALLLISTGITTIIANVLSNR